MNEKAVVFHAVWYRGWKSGDLWNRNKVLEAALQGVAYDNDSQIAEAHRYVSDREPHNPRLEVCVLPIGDIQDSVL